MRFCLDHYKAFFQKHLHISREEEEREEDKERSNDTASRVKSIGGVLFWGENDVEQKRRRKSDDDDDERRRMGSTCRFMYDRLEIEAIETRCGVELESDGSECDLAGRLARERVGERGRKSGEYEKSVEQYTAAIAGARKDKTLWRNERRHGCRSERLEAIHDSVKAVELDEKDAKSWYRLGTSLMANHEYLKAACKLNTRAGSDAGEQRYRRTSAAREMYEEERKRKEREEKAVRRDLALRLRKARREDRNQETINQWKQTLGWTGLGRGDCWRPTFLPIARSIENRLREIHG